MPAQFDRYVPNNREFRQYMLSDEAGAASGEIAYDIALEAIALAGRSADDEVHYGANVKVNDTVVVLKDGPYVNPRAATEIVAQVPYAAALEFGTKTAKAKRPLSRAAALAAAEGPGIEYGAHGGDSF